VLKDEAGQAPLRASTRFFQHLMNRFEALKQMLKAECDSAHSSCRDQHLIDFHLPKSRNGE
jgi:hypothetical protein